MTQRFAFGKNWRRFLEHLNEERIEEAVKSLRTMLGRDALDGLTFLDIGSGSGLFSLAARRLGATVRSFDYDMDSVACTEELRRRFYPEDAAWVVSRGDVLDESFMTTLDAADIVYSWGVLHHTGNMMKALDQAGRKVKPGGQLFIAIYNDQGGISRRWLKVKQLYCSGLPGRWLVTALGSLYFFLVLLKEDLIRFRNPVNRYREYKKNRGMSMITDWIDWFGGYPFEVAKPEVLFEFYKDRKFVLEKMVTVGGSLACIEMVFRYPR
ncbi:MAG TPA: class I SAM-dependent methyltransferase [Kiritimatiellia bacterium]|nr:class I SAM-dependent methyltransferase [Kiritimatiellia bacterium]